MIDHGSSRAHAAGPIRWMVAAGLTIMGCGCTAYASCAVWQLCALLDEAADIARAAAARAPLPSARPAGATTLVRDTNSVVPAAALDPIAPQVDLAEAHEKPVPLAIEASVAESLAPCDDIYVYIVSIAEDDPRRSAASIGMGKGAPARLRQPGHSIGDWEVVSINDDWSGLNPDVWLRKDGSVCRAELAGNPARVHLPLRSRAKQKAARGRRGRRRR